MQGLRIAKKRGVCSWIGITGNNARHLTYVLGGVGVDCCLSAFNFDLIHRSAIKWIEPVTRERGKAMVLGAILGMLRGYRDEWLAEPPQHMPQPFARSAGVPLCDRAESA